MNENVSNGTPYYLLQVMGQYNDVKSTLATYVLCDCAKKGCDHHNAINRIEIRLITRCHATPASRIAVELTIEGAAVSDAASRVAETMVVDLTVHVSTSTFKLFMPTLVL